MSYGALELVKWLAFAAMLLDHVAVIVRPEWTWLRQVGAFAFPAFALSFGHGLALARDPMRTATALIVPASVATLAWALVGPQPSELHVLWSFVVAALFAVLANMRSPWMVAPAFALVLPLGIFEGGLLGGLMILTAFHRQRAGSWWWLLPAFTWLWFFPTVAALLAFVVYAFAPLVDARFAPQKARWLLWAYPAHVSAFAAIRALW